MVSECTEGCLTSWKIGFAALLLVEGVVFGHLVFLLKCSGRRFNLILHLGHALSAGVFFATGVLHVLPEAIELFEGTHSEEVGEDSHEQEEEDPHHDEGTHNEDDGHNQHTTFAWPFFVLMVSFYVLFFIEKILLPKVLSHRESQKAHMEVEDPRETMNEKSEQSAMEDNIVIGSAEKGFASTQFVTGVIEILGLSAHSLFESMALGLSGEFDTVLNIFIATAAHRWATATAISFKLVRHLSYFPFLVLLLLFSSMVPLGIGIGAALTSLSSQARGILFAISAGTFIYIGVFETMSEEFVEHKSWPLRKFAFTLIGAAAITIVTVILSVLGIHE